MSDPCPRCDELLDELTRTRAELADHAIAGYRRVQGDLLTLQASRR